MFVQHKAIKGIETAVRAVDSGEAVKEPSTNSTREKEAGVTSTQLRSVDDLDVRKQDTPKGIISGDQLVVAVIQENRKEKQTRRGDRGV